MRGKRAIGTAALALALAAGVAGPAQAMNMPASSGKAVKDVPGYEIVQTTGTVGDLLEACCPVGKLATGGGVQTDGQATVTQTYPLPDGSGWVGQAQRAGSNAPVTVYAVCA